MSHMIKYVLNCILDQIGKCHDGYEAQSSLYEYKLYELTTLIQKQCNKFKSCVFANLMIPVSTFIDFNV